MGSLQSSAARGAPFSASRLAVQSGRCRSITAIVLELWLLAIRCDSSWTTMYSRLRRVLNVDGLNPHHISGLSGDDLA